MHYGNHPSGAHNKGNTRPSEESDGTERQVSRSHLAWAQVRRERRNGELSDDPVDAMERFLQVVDEIGEFEKALAEHGLTPHQLLEIAAECRDADGGHTEYWRGEGARLEPTARKAIRNLYLRNLPSEKIARIVGRPVEAVDDYIENQHMEEQTQDILRLHLQGSTPLEIEDELGVSRMTVYRVLETADETPNRKLQRLDERTKRRIVALRKKGCKYSEIAEELGVEDYQIKNTIRSAKRRGEI